MKRTQLRRKTPLRSRARLGSHKNSKLATYRRKQAEIAAERDEGVCQLCGGPGDDVHHVFGRGRTVENPRERHTALMVVCRECHPAPLYSHDPGTSEHKVAVRMREINE